MNSRQGRPETLFTAVMLGSAVLLWLLFAITTRGAKPLSAVIFLTPVLAVFVGIIGLIKQGARNPKRSFAALYLVYGINFILGAFSNVYYALGTTKNFGQSLTHIDAVYFTVSNLATLGFGDIKPLTQSARAIVTAQMLIDLIYVGVAVTLLLSTLSGSSQAKQSENVQ